MEITFHLFYYTFLMCPSRTCKLSQISMSVLLYGVFYFLIIVFICLRVSFSLRWSVRAARTLILWKRGSAAP